MYYVHTRYVLCTSYLVPRTMYKYIPYRLHQCISYICTTSIRYYAVGSIVPRNYYAVHVYHGASRKSAYEVPRTSYEVPRTSYMYIVLCTTLQAVYLYIVQVHSTSYACRALTISTHQKERQSTAAHAPQIERGSARVHACTQRSTHARTHARTLDTHQHI